MILVIPVLVLMTGFVLLQFLAIAHFCFIQPKEVASQIKGVDRCARSGLLWHRDKMQGAMGRVSQACENYDLTVSQNN